MGDFGRQPRPKVWFFLLSASTCLTSGAAFADLTRYVAVNPIDVCASNGTGCAPVNNISGGQTVLNGPNIPVGMFDAASQTSITRAILNAIGVDMAFGPIQQYNSAPNVSRANPKAYADTDYRTLHVFQTTNSQGE